MHVIKTYLELAAETPNIIAATTTVFGRRLPTQIRSIRSAGALGELVKQLECSQYCHYSGFDCYCCCYCYVLLQGLILDSHSSESVLCVKFCLKSWVR